MPITYLLTYPWVYCNETKISFTALAQANKMISRFLLLDPSFTMKQAFKKIRNFFSIYTSISPIVFNALYYKLRLVSLCPVFLQIQSHIYRLALTTVDIGDSCDKLSW